MALDDDNSGGLLDQFAGIDSQEEAHRPVLEALAELAERELCRKRLLPFVMKSNPSYVPGWVHKDICIRLERFSQQVANKESPRLMITMPPRSGKSELASRTFPAWHLGKFPDHEFISCSYSGQLANDFSRKVRNLMREPLYQSIFGTRLDPETQAVSFWATTDAGGYMPAGTGGAITGRGAHCLVGGTKVATDKGVVRIDTLAQSFDRYKVYSYNESKDAIELRPVVASKRTLNNEIYEITTLSGRTVKATGQHRFFIHGRGYVEAQSLRVGDNISYLEKQEEHPLRRLRSGENYARSGLSPMLPTVQEDCSSCGVRFLRQGSREESIRSKKGIETRAQGFLLQPGVQQGASCDKEQAKMCDVRRSLPKEDNEILQQGVQKNCTQQDTSEGEGVRVVWGNVSSEVLTGEILREDVCRQSPLAAHERVREQLLQDGYKLLEIVPRNEEPHSGSGRTLLRCLSRASIHPQDAGWQNGEQSGSTSYRPCTLEQHPREPYYDVRGVSSVSPPLQQESIRSITRISCEQVPVYDIQVEGNSNFFAEGILTHNCAIIDDPVKNREEAESETVRQSVWDWYTSTLYTRLAPGGGLLVIQTRWHHDDLAGRLLEEMQQDGEQWELVEYPAIAVDDETYRRKGEALHPERYPIEALERIKRTIGPRDFQALYQQKPSAAEGDYFTKGMVRYYRTPDLPDRDTLRFYTAWDTAVATKESNDWSVGITVALDQNENIWVVDLVRRRMDSADLVEDILDTWELYRSDLTGIEEGVIRHAIGPFLDKRIEERRAYSFNPEPLKVGRADKVARARAIQGRMKQGRVFIPEDAGFTPDFINELLQFPNGKHDDQVDALAHIGQMLSDMSTVLPAAKKKKKSWRDRLKGTTTRRSAMSA